LNTESFLFKKAKSITPELYKYIRLNCLKTGSHIFGGYTEKSDIDYITHKQFFNEKLFLDYHFGVNSGSVLSDEIRNTLYLKYTNEENKHLLLNILIFKDKIEYVIWLLAQDDMCNLQFPFTQIVKNKKNRVKLFNLLKAFYRSEYVKER